ncbi:putative elongation factor TypA-like svr3, chloroplastic [Trebouxia sp. C0010 RCD-2024]
MQGALLPTENGPRLLLQHNRLNCLPLGARLRTAPFCSTGENSTRKYSVRRQQRAPRCQVHIRAAATLEGQLAEPVNSDTLTHKHDIRNIAIIAHVDHGKTTLVDSMLKQSKVFRAGQHTQERIMDSNDIERERGITILSKNTAVRYKGIKINIIDTPGHADFGGEVERVLNMCDGVLLLVDSVEGPMPQTRFVLRKSLALNKKVIVVVNKIDRDAARPDFVIDTTFELFCELGASDEQCDFPAVYASGVNGTAGMLPHSLADDLEPLFEAIVKEIQPPAVKLNSPLQMLVTNLDYDDHKGRIAIGRVSSGCISKAEQVSYLKPDSVKTKTGKIAELFVYDNFNRVPAERVEAGDICAFTGLSDVGIGETVCARDAPNALPTIEVEEPTVRMTFLVNTSAFAGKEGKFVTSRNLKERLNRELERNLALRVESGETADAFIVSGRGALHISILMENMRREGYEFAVGPPTVITKQIDGHKCEPYEEAVVEVPEEHVGPVVDMLGQRKGQMLDLVAGETGGLTRITYKIPTRGLLGIRSAMLTATKGTAMLNTIFSEYGPWSGPIATRENGSLTAHEQGQVTSYALESIQQRGKLFCGAGEQVYEDQVVGIHQRNNDLKVNVCKKKQVTNIRSATKEATTSLNEPMRPTLDEALEYVVDDELVEVTPQSVRIRKNPLAGKRR